MTRIRSTLGHTRRTFVAGCARSDDREHVAPTHLIPVLVEEGKHCPKRASQRTERRYGGLVRKNKRGTCLSDAHFFGGNP